MAMEITNNYSNYAAGSMAGSGAANSTQKKKAERTPETVNSKSQSTDHYMRELEKLAPSVEFRVGNGHASAKTGQTLTINPKLLEKMQNDPEKEKEMKELIRGVETMTKLSDSMNSACGWKTVFRHSYIDENGKYCHIALIRNEHGYKMSEKLREERKKNSEKLIEKSKKKAAKRKEELQETLEKKRMEKGEEILKEKIEASKDGRVYMSDSEFKTIIGTVQKKPIGVNMDLRI